jgi:hypothetical protein
MLIGYYSPANDSDDSREAGTYSSQTTRRYTQINISISIMSAIEMPNMAFPYSGYNMYLSFDSTETMLL